MSNANRSDPSLLQACLDGHQWAWELLVERYERLVYSVALKARLTPADADDVFQTVFFSLHRHMESLKDQTRLSAWLITTTHRESWRVLKRRSRHGATAELSDEPAAVEPDELEQAESQHLVRQSLTQLGGPCEKLLKALFMENSEPNYPDIAARLGMPIGSIGPTRARCLKKLERILVQNGFESDAAVMGLKGDGSEA